MDAVVNKSWGRKVFFLYPHASIREMLFEIVRHEYEVYLLEDHTCVVELLQKYEGALIFINIDQRLKEKEWEQYTRDLLANPQLKGVRVGILSYSQRDQELIKKYLMDVGVQCGFVAVELNPELNKGTILKILEANEAKGQRKYIRAICRKELDTFNMMYEGIRYEGAVLNLSLVGMACSLNKVTTLITVKALLKNIQLILRGARCMVSGVVTDIKQTDKGESIYVILFDHKGMENRIKEKIHTFIYNCLQEKMQEEIMELKGTKTKAEKETRLKTDKVVKEVKAANDAVI